MLPWINAFYTFPAIMTMRLPPNRQLPCHWQMLSERTSKCPRCQMCRERPLLRSVKSLLLALNEGKILPEREILNILRDAAAAHENVPEIDGNADLHNAVAALINRILSGGNSVRRR